MTRSEIEQQALGLPGKERAALAQALLRSIDEQAAIDALMAPWFEGESREMTAEDWARIRRGEYRHPPEANSLAVPPGWVSPRLKG